MAIDYPSYYSTGGAIKFNLGSKSISLMLIIFFSVPAFAEQPSSKEKLKIDARLSKTISLQSENKIESLYLLPINNYQSPRFNPIIYTRPGLYDQTVPEADYDDLDSVKNNPVDFNKLPNKKFSADLIQQCSIAHLNLQHNESKLSKRLGVTQLQLSNPYEFFQTWYGYENLFSSDLKAYKDAMSEFNDKCLSSPLDYVKSAEKITRIVGVLSQIIEQSSVVICTAFRIAPNRIVTAKHCLSSEVEVAINEGNLNFHLSSNTSRERVKVLGETCLLKNTESLAACSQINSDRLLELTKNDYMVLEVEAMQTPFPKIVWKKQENYNDNSPTSLVSWLSYPALIEVSNEALSGNNDYTIKSEELRVPIKGYCSIAVASNACILHGCQATRGSSGAPLIAWSDGDEFRIIGIHVAAANKSSTDHDCPVDKVRLKTNEYLGNLAIPISKSILEIAEQ